MTNVAAHAGAGIDVFRNGDVLELRLNRSERRNALGLREWEALNGAFDDVATYDAGIVMLSGNGPVFCAGVDLEMIKAAQQKPDGMVQQIGYVGKILEKIEHSPAIVIATLNGPAIGVGVHLALGADFVLSTAESYFHLPEASLGIPDVLHHRLLSERLGRSKGFSFALLGERLTAQDALRAGLIYRVCPDVGALEEDARDLVRRLSAVSAPVRAAFKRQAVQLMALGSADAQISAVSQIDSKQQSSS